MNETHAHQHQLAPMVFISYSHKDAKWRDRILSHMKPLVAQGILHTWYDGQMQSGDSWQEVLMLKYCEADIALLLISPDFLASDWILHEEVPRLLERRETDGVHLIPVLLRPCAWHGFPWLAQLQMFPKTVKPLSELRAAKRDTTLVDLGRTIEAIATKLSQQAAPIFTQPPVLTKNSSAMAPPKVFISYAHSSPEHKQTVADLTVALRSNGLTVVVDADVNMPQGPPEGWPKWMKRQLKEADWVLIFFDDRYRRRFDGDEEPRTGLGATWEGAIITNHYYREGTLNNKFIPLLADEASTDLIPDELFSYSRYYIPRQSSELAVALSTPTSAETSAAKQVQVNLGKAAPMRQIVITLDTDFDSFGPTQQERFLSAVAMFLGMAEVTIKSIRPGSVKITFELPEEYAIKLVQVVASGALKEFHAVYAKLLGLSSDSGHELRSRQAKHQDHAQAMTRAQLIRLQSRIYNSGSDFAYLLAHISPVDGFDRSAIRQNQGAAVFWDDLLHQIDLVKLQDAARIFRELSDVCPRVQDLFRTIATSYAASIGTQTLFFDDILADIARQHGPSAPLP